jgi:hypothetical protein
MSELIGRFEAAYSLIADRRGYIDAQTVGRNDPLLLGVSLECNSSNNLIDNSSVRKVVYRHYFSNPQAANTPSGIHAELSVDGEERIDPYFARTFAEGTGADVAYSYQVMHEDRTIQSERIMGVVERALSALGLRPQ